MRLRLGLGLGHFVCVSFNIQHLVDERSELCGKLPPAWRRESSAANRPLDATGDETHVHLISQSNGSWSRWQQKKPNDI